MSGLRSSLYQGTVVHKRLRPVTHKLAYKVFALLVDLDELHEIDRKLRFVSYNRFNMVSLNDRDHGRGLPLRDYLFGIANEAGFGDEIRRISMLCYPRVFGYVFNPLTTYFCLDSNNQIRLIVYEVNNTFGERMTYVLPAEQDSDGVVTQQTPKQLYVSPYNDVSGEYSFHVKNKDDHLTVGVSLADDDGPLLNAYFSGDSDKLTDRNVLQAVAKTGWMTVKVIAGIHYEALKLWVKGLRVVPRPAPPNPPIKFGNQTDAKS